MSDSRIHALLKELEQHLSSYSTVNPKVSKVSIGWHIAHSTKVFSAICKNFSQSDPANYVGGFNKNRFKIWLIGYIPRGLGRAPKSVATEQLATVEEIQTYIQQCKELFKAVQEGNSSQYSEHPYFGHLNKRRTKWFLHLHTKHHLKIIRDILK